MAKKALAAWVKSKAGAPFVDLGDSKREAFSVSNSISEMRDAHEKAASALNEAREHLSKGERGARAAKDKIIEAHQALKNAGEGAVLTRSTASHRLMQLPQYGTEHAFTKARNLAQEHSALTDKTMAMKSSLTRATTGSHEEVSKAMADFDASHPRDEQGRFTSK
jgi:hypothetical protein